MSDRRLARETFRKRRNNFLKRGCEISKTFQANVYILIEKGGKYYTFKSTDRTPWPPTQSQLERSKVISKSAADFNVVSRAESNTKQARAIKANTSSISPSSQIKFPPPPRMEPLAMDFIDGKGRKRSSTEQK